MGGGARLPWAAVPLDRLTDGSWDLGAEPPEAAADPQPARPACPSLTLLASALPCVSASGGRTLEVKGGLARPPLPSPGSGQVAPAKSLANGVQLAPGWASVRGKRAPCAQRKAHSGLQLWPRAPDALVIQGQALGILAGRLPGGGTSEMH